MSNKSGAQAIVDVVGVIGDVIGNGGHLCLRAGEAPELADPSADSRGSRAARRFRDSDRSRCPRASVSGPLCLHQPFQRFPGQVQSVEIGIAALQRGHDLAVPARCGRSRHERRHGVVERALAGMAEGRMAEIMRKRQRLPRDPRQGPARGASDRAIWGTSSVWVSRVR